MLLYLPVIGSLLRKIAVGRFTRTLGTLITSGVPILEGLTITAKTSGNAVLEEALMKVRKAIEEGRTIVDPLRECGVFPNMVTQMIGVGEATGAMDSMLQKIADFYEEEVDAATKDMLAMLEPVIIGTARRHHRRHRHFALHAAVRHDRQAGWLRSRFQGAKVSKFPSLRSRETLKPCNLEDLETWTLHAIDIRRAQLAGLAGQGPDSHPDPPAGHRAGGRPVQPTRRAHAPVPQHHSASGTAFRCSTCSCSPSGGSTGCRPRCRF